MTRIHVVSLPHTLLTPEYAWCAYTAKVWRFITMLTMAGHEPIVYASDVRTDKVQDEAAAYHAVVTEVDRVQWFGQPEWPTDRVFDRWDENDICWRTMNTRAAALIRENWQPGDILGLIGGLCQKQIIDELADLAPLVCEWGIGYSGVIPGTHRVYESYAWMHHVAARLNTDDIRFFDTVIPNCFDEDEFIVSKKPGDYLLFVGRPNPRKGLAIVADIAKHSDLPLVVAGQPGADLGGIEHEHVGVVTGKAKAELFAGARALLCPTLYLEPFGGVAVEAMMSGTPAIATDYGAFTETIRHGYTGFRCRTLAEFMLAVEQAETLDRAAIASYARTQYSLTRGSISYDDYLQKLDSLYAEGWYANLPDPR